MIRLLSLFAALALAVPPAFADGAPALKAAVTVSSGLVTIGDLVANAGAKADIAIFRAPDLGETGKVAARDVLDAARARGLSGIETLGLSAVSVTRDSRVVTAQEIEGALAEALVGHAGLAEPEAIRIELDAALAPIHLPVEADGAVRIADAVWHRERGLFDAALVVRRIDGREERRALRGKAVETVPVITSARALDRGAVLTAADVEIIRMPKSDVRDGALADERLAVGMELRRSLRAGQPVRGADLAEPELVKRGSAVTIVHRAGGLMLTATAEALGDGVRGDVVEVRNLQSRRVVHAIVTGPDQVAVIPPRTLVSAAK